MSALRIAVCGLIGQYPLGGTAWVYAQYLLGLRALGHDVYYLEDTGQWPYDPVGGGRDHAFRHNVGYVRDVMAWAGLQDRWGYRVMTSPDWAGMGERRVREVLDSADLVIDVSGAAADPAALRGRRARLVYVDTDPVFTQVRIAAGQLELKRRVDAFDLHFSFAERWDDPLPETGHAWRPTRPPVVLDAWETDERPVPARFTTVMNWTSYKPVSYAGRTYGQKDVEFTRFLDLPGAVRPATLEVALTAGKTRRPPRELLAHRGWRVVAATAACPDPQSYRRYLQGSAAEWSVAKHGYVLGASGWFSDRSACYLAAGRPVVVQDTGLRDVPTGTGVLTFSDRDGAAAAMQSVQADYPRHAAAARAIAAEHFGADRVLGALVAEAMAHA
jgi:hypothetical protein